MGKAANLYEDAGYKLSGASYVVNKFLGTTWLWDRVRVVGGAYGGFSDFDSHSGKRLPHVAGWSRLVAIFHPLRECCTRLLHTSSRSLTLPLGERLL